VRVCFVVDYYPPDRLGGVGESACRLKETLQANGHEVIVLTTGTRSTDEDMEKNVVRLSKYLPFFPLILLFRFPLLLKKHGFDVIHFHHSIGVTVMFWKWLCRGKFPATVFTFKCSRPHIVESIKNITVDGKVLAKPSRSDRRTKLTFSILSRVVDGTFVRSCDYLTANSADTREKNIRNFGIPADKIVVVHNGVDTERYRPDVDGGAIRKQYGMADDEVLALYVGGFSIRKRIPLLLHMLSRLKGESCDFKLMIVGSGKGYESVLQRMASELGVSDAVIFTGFVENARLPLYYAAADMVLVPSEYEPFGIINIEAMAVGRSVVASTAGGMCDIVVDGVTGFLVDKDDFEDFGEKVGFLARNPRERKKMGSAALSRVLELFTWDRIKDKYLQAYEEARNRKAGRRT